MVKVWLNSLGAFGGCRAGVRGFEAGRRLSFALNDMRFEGEFYVQGNSKVFSDHLSLEGTPFDNGGK